MLDPQIERAMCEHILRTVGPLRAPDRLSSFVFQLTPAFHP
jgi:hypothetical protein